MTEAEWLGCKDVGGLLRLLPSGANERKLRLFACACCRRIWSLLADERSREAVEAAERLADARHVEGGQRIAEAHAKAHAAASRAAGDPASPRPASAAWAAERASRPEIAACDVESAALNAAWASAGELTAIIIGRIGKLTRAGRSAVRRRDESARWGYATLLRDIFGNPFRPVAFAPQWRTDTAIALAAQMYESPDFSAMPILADALQDAGCDNAEILDHCRGPGEHVRGCWVIDLLLGKE